MKKKQLEEAGIIPKIRSRFAFKLESKDMERTTGASMTVPDDSYTIMELLHRYETGQPIPVARTGSYDDMEEEDYDHIDSGKYLRGDVTDQFLAQQENAEKFSQKEKSYREQKAAELRKKEEEEKAKKAQIQAKNAEKAASQNQNRGESD